MKIRGRSLVVCLGMFCLSAGYGQQYTIKTLAGNGSAAFAGDNGDPAAAQLNSPHAVALAFLVGRTPLFAIPKSSNPAHVESNLAAGDLVLDADDLARIDKAFPLGAWRGLPTL